MTNPHLEYLSDLLFNHKQVFTDQEYIKARDCLICLYNSLERKKYVLSFEEVIGLFCMHKFIIYINECIYSFLLNRLYVFVMLLPLVSEKWFDVIGSMSDLFYVYITYIVFSIELKHSSLSTWSRYYVFKISPYFILSLLSIFYDFEDLLQNTQCRTNILKWTLFGYNDFSCYFMILKDILLLYYFALGFLLHTTCYYLKKTRENMT